MTHLNGYLAGLLELKPSVEELVDNLYLSDTLPTPDGRGRAFALVGRAERGPPTSSEAAEDLFWALAELASEFAFNH